MKRKLLDELEEHRQKRKKIEDRCERMKSERKDLMSRAGKLTAPIKKAEKNIQSIDTDIDNVNRKLARIVNESDELRKVKLDLLPVEILKMITSYLNHYDVLSIRKVNSIMRRKVDFKEFLRDCVKEDEIIEQRLPIDDRAVTSVLRSEDGCYRIHVEKLVGTHTERHVSYFAKKIGVKTWKYLICNQTNEIKAYIEIDSAEKISKYFDEFMQQGLIIRFKNGMNYRTKDDKIFTVENTNKKSDTIHIYLYDELQAHGKMFSFKKPNGLRKKFKYIGYTDDHEMVFDNDYDTYFFNFEKSILYESSKYYKFNNYGGDDEIYISKISRK